MSERFYGANIHLPSLDNLFSTEEERQEAKLEKVQNLSLTELRDFAQHPFPVHDDEEMRALADSIFRYGVMTPAIVRTHPDGGYELVSGHRRCRGAKLAGLETLPCLVREMDTDTAIVLMVDSNCQRERILPCEKARAYKMKLDALKRQGTRSDLTSGQVGTRFRADKMVAEKLPDSARQVQRYIRLTELIPELQALVDAGTLKFNPAVEISYLTRQEQEDFFEYIDGMSCTPSLSQAQKLKAASRSGILDPEMIQAIMTSQPPSVKPREPQVSIACARIEQYFPRGYTTDQMAGQIIRMLEEQFRNQKRRAPGWER